MGTTGSTLASQVDEGLPDLLARVRAQTPLPLAVGFGVATRKHFEIVAEAGAAAVVVGSRIVAILKGAGTEISTITRTIEQYCRELTLKGQEPTPKASSIEKSASIPALPIQPSGDSNPTPVKAFVDAQTIKSGTNLLPARFGQFGGQYVPEALVDCLIELEETHKAAIADPAFWREFESHYGYINRPSNLYEANRLTEFAQGARIWFKREDLSVPSLCCFPGIVD
jgi:tryptophan synthase